jgi:hypothetical protein
MKKKKTVSILILILIGLGWFAYMSFGTQAGRQAGWHGNMRRQAGLGWLGWQYALAGWQ